MRLFRGIIQMGKRFNKRGLKNTSTYGQADRKKQSNRKKKNKRYLTEANGQENFKKKWSLSVKICREGGGR